MLASITPLGERGRRSNWRVTVTAFLIGATAAAAAVGAALGALGSVVLPTHADVAVLLVAIGVAIVLDGLPLAVPGPRRQVDERWLDRYRGWVYGAGYGAQLGVGVTTIVSSAAIYVALLAAFLTASASAGAIVLGCFGVVRGLTPLAAGGVRSQRQLFDFHQALGRWRPAARWGTVAAQAGMLVAALALS
jgi:sulfite exporter TauE/SafE